mmetsp:Transcript_38381/g.123882  ORF Transcript_38381/g.123882 Transcript_38381/m.123882 type:complete len:269 (+) Transcript_38381:383-1189(+)
MPLAQRTEPALTSQTRQCTDRFSESESSLPNGSRNDFERARKPRKKTQSRPTSGMVKTPTFAYSAKGASATRQSTRIWTRCTYARGMRAAASSPIEAQTARRARALSRKTVSMPAPPCSSAPCRAWTKRAQIHSSTTEWRCVSETRYDSPTSSSYSSRVRCSRSHSRERPRSVRSTEREAPSSARAGRTWPAQKRMWKRRTQRAISSSSARARSVKRPCSSRSACVASRQDRSLSRPCTLRVLPLFASQKPYDWERKKELMKVANVST